MINPFTDLSFGVWIMGGGFAALFWTKKLWWVGLILIGGFLATITGCAATPPPVIVQAAPTPAPTPIPIPPDPYSSLPTDIAQAIKTNEQPPPTFRHGITTIYPYSPDEQFPLYCEQQKVCMIRLRDDEQTDEHNVKIGDTDRWGVLIGPHQVTVFPRGNISPLTVPVPGATQLDPQIQKQLAAEMTQPADPHMITNLSIHTSAGNDYIFNPLQEVKSTRRDDARFTERVAFYYPDWIRQLDVYRKQLMQQENK